MVAEVPLVPFSTTMLTSSSSLPLLFHVILKPVTGILSFADKIGTNPGSIEGVIIHRNLTVYENYRNPGILRS